MTSTYIPGLGYTVRDARGRVLGSSLTPQQRDALLACQDCSVLSQQLLDTLRSA